jgi:hypothetical protein
MAASSEPAAPGAAGPVAGRALAAEPGGFEFGVDGADAQPASSAAMATDLAKGANPLEHEEDVLA